MQVLKNFNNISEELKATIPVLEIGAIRRFRMLTAVLNNDPDYTERMKRPVFYGTHQIPTKDRIKDPFAKNKYVDIGVVEEFDLATERPTRFRLFVPGNHITITGMWNGEFYLQGGITEDEELFEYLWISNYREGNQYRNTKVDPMFEEITDENEMSVSDKAIMETQLEQIAKSNPEAIQQYAKKMQKNKKKEIGVAT